MRITFLNYDNAVQFGNENHTSFHNWWCRNQHNQHYSSSPHVFTKFRRIIKSTLSCSDPELKDLQYNSNLKVKQQVDLIVLADPEIKKIINASTYCEIMSVLTGYSENETYQDNINLNNTKNLVVQISLQNNSVVSYELVNLTRDYPAIEVSPFNFILPYVIIGAIIVGIFVLIILIRRNRK